MRRLDGENLMSNMGVLLGTRIVLEMGHNMMGPNLIYQEINYFLKELNTIINY
jgi:hypothetical protein